MKFLITILFGLLIGTLALQAISLTLGGLAVVFALATMNVWAAVFVAWFPLVSTLFVYGLVY